MQYGFRDCDKAFILGFVHRESRNHSLSKVEIGKLEVSNSLGERWNISTWCQVVTVNTEIDMFWRYVW